MLHVIDHRALLWFLMISPIAHDYIYPMCPDEEITDYLWTGLGLGLRLLLGVEAGVMDSAGVRVGVSVRITFGVGIRARVRADVEVRVGIRARVRAGVEVRVKVGAGVRVEIGLVLGLGLRSVLGLGLFSLFFCFGIVRVTVVTF